MTAPIDLRYTDPLTGSGALDGTNVGVTDAVWADVVGAGTRGGTATTFSGAVSGTAFAAADFGMADADVRVETFTGLGGGDALYFRVSDALNWWRIRQRHHRVTSSYYGPWYGTGWVWTETKYSEGVNWSSIEGNNYSEYSNGIPQRLAVVVETTPWMGNRNWRADIYRQSVTRDTYQSTSNYRYLIVEKCVAGTVSAVTSWQVSAFGVLRVDLFGDSVQWYEPDGISVRGGVTDAFNNDATHHGFGVGGQDSVVYSSLLHDFRVQLPGSLVPPSIESPADGADVDIALPVKIRVASNYGPDNPLTNVDIRWRVQGAGSWNDVPGALAGPGEWVLPTAGMTAPIQIEIQARSTDSFSNTSAYSGSTFFTLRNAPTPPTFTAPPPGTVVVAGLIATVDFSVDAVQMQARRIGEDPNSPGVPDTETVYEDSLVLTPTQTPGIYDLSGDGDIHPFGNEFIQARRRTSDGGSMWSDWVSLPVTMSLARPYAPKVTWTPLPDDAAIVFEVRTIPGDAQHPDGTELGIYRNGERIFVTPAQPLIRWLYDKPGDGDDFEFRLSADNGGVVVVK